MYKKLFFLLCIFAALASVSHSQTTKFQAPVAVKISSGSDNLDPFGILENDDEKASGVKASVVVSTTGVERTAFDLINKIRIGAGAQPLAWNDDVAAIARTHSQNMAEFNFFSHRGLDSKLVSDRADAQQVGKWRAIGENIAFNRGYKDPAEMAVQLWLDSAEHRRNLMDSNWKESAVGVAVAADGSYYFTQVFLVRR